MATQFQSFLACLEGKELGPLLVNISVVILSHGLLDDKHHP